ncbi:CASP-like protein [Rhynchospora pubera]|nr:CASP-like protein [Rhynchospora pubera]
MAVTEMTDTLDTVKTAPESGYTTSDGPPPNYFRIDFLLRLLLLVAAVISLVVLVTSKESEVIAVLPQPFGAIIRDAKFNYSPAFIYLVVALGVASLYSIKTMIFSCAVMSRPAPSAKILFGLIIFDILMAAIMASAVGTAGGIGYLGLKGNSHTNWVKFCDIYGKFCRHVAASIILSLFASIILVLLVVLSAYSLYKRSN